MLKGGLNWRQIQLFFCLGFQSETSRTVGRLRSVSVRLVSNWTITVIDVNANPHDSNVRKGEDSDVCRREDAMKRFLRWRQVKGVLRIG